MEKHSTSTMNLRMTVYCGLFTALIIIGAYISIPLPIGPVPIGLADFFVMVTGLFIGWKYGLLSVGLYLGLGALGLPVFSGGSSGFAALLGPSGGFLLGYLLLVFAIGLITSQTKSSLIGEILAILVGNVLLYASGITWLKFVLDVSWSTALAMGLIPFIPGTVIKMIVVLALGRMLLPKFKETMVSF